MNTNAAIGMHPVAAIFFVRNERTAIAPGDDLVETGRSPASTRVRCDHLCALLAPSEISLETLVKNENSRGLIVSDNCAFT